MDFLLILTCSIVTLLGFGCALPARFRTKARRTIAAPPELVRGLLGNPQRLPVSGKMCKKVSDHVELEMAPTWVEHIGSSVIEVRWDFSGEAAKYHFFDRVTKATAEGTVTLTPAADGCEVELSREMHVGLKTYHAPLIRITLLLGGLRAGANGYLAQLARVCRTDTAA